MKTSFKILTLATLMIVVSFGVMADGVLSGKGGIHKHKSLFVYRAQKNMVGAQVEIFSSNGELLTTQTLHKKKMVIDFNSARFGNYTIRITKGIDTKEFHYTKK